MPSTLSDLLTQEGVALETGAALEETLSEATQEVIALLPESCLREAAVEVNVPKSGGLDISGLHVIMVHVGGVEAVGIGLEEETSWTNGGTRSHIRRSRYGYLLDGGSLRCLEIGSGKVAGSALVVAVPDVVKPEAITIAGFRSRRFTRLVALRAAIDLKLRDIRLLRSTDLPNMSVLTFGSLPGVPAAPSFTYTPASAGSITPTTIVDPGSPTPPTAPSEPTNPSEPTAPTAPTTASLITTLPADPAYNKQGPFDLPDDQTAPTSSDWAVYMQKESADAMLQVLLSYFDKLTSEFLANVQDELNEASEELEIWRTKVEELFREAQLDHEFNQQTFRGKIDLYTAQVAYQLGAFRDIFPARIQDYVAQGNFEIEIHRQLLEKNIQQARVTLEEQVAGAANTTNVNIQNAAENLKAQIEEYAASLRRHNEQMNEYLGESKRQTDTVASMIELFTAKVRNLRFEFQDLQRRFQEALRSYIRNRRQQISPTIRVGWP